MTSCFFMDGSTKSPSLTCQPAAAQYSDLAPGLRVMSLAGVVYRAAVVALAFNKRGFGDSAPVEVAVPG